MPSGAYRLSAPEQPDVIERFRCAPGPHGWRYVATREDVETSERYGAVDITVDDTGRQVRVEVRSRRWAVRGGVVGPEARWARVPDGFAVHFAGSPLTEQAARACGFSGTSPGFLVALSRLVGDEVALPVLRIGDDSLGVVAGEERWRPLGVTVHDTDEAALPVRAYDVLTPEWAGQVHVAGDVVLDAPGVELLELDSPPTL